MVYAGEGEENLMFNIYLKHLLASWPAWNKNENDIFCDKLDETCFDYVWHACDTGGPGQCWGSLSPARAAQLRPDTNCIILSNQLILEDLLTQTHITSVVSCVSREWKCKVTSVRAGEFPQSRLRLVTDHISPKLPQPSPPPFVSRLWQKLSSMPRQHLSSGQEIDSESHLIQGFLQLRPRLKLGPPRLP